MPEEILSDPILPRPVRSSGTSVWIAALAAFALGLGAAGWLGWRSGADFEHGLGLSPGAANRGFGPDLASRRSGQASTGAIAPGTAAPDAIALAGRVAALEQRLDRLDLRVDSASGNAARAEALLVAFAVRRVVERGAPLDYLADQLKLRFGDAQPRAVATIIGEARDMLPLDQLAAQLETMAPQLTATGQQSLWTRVTRELSEMLVIRRDAPVLSDADARLNDARMALSQGHIDQAIADVGHLSSGNDAARWTTAARRYRDVEAALDLIDTTALLEPRQLHDAAGNPANQTLN
ncbi:MAG: hypothetical protein M3N34_05920 [Pseudomonadota bacterium]|nr:hypothetical protein [Pseudomonadota bacterium]